MKLLFVSICLISILAALGIGLSTNDVMPSVQAAEAADACVRLADPEYIGAKKCKKCHFKHNKSWGKTSMAKSFESLKPGNDADVKKKFGLDPKKDYSKDATCLPCHTTGYGKPGGYPRLVEGKAWTEEETKRAALMEGVQCESCHGPGSLTGPFKKENKKYKKQEVLDLGMVEPNAANCKTCHNDKNPVQPKDYKFDFKKLTEDKSKIHENYKLKYEH